MNKTGRNDPCPCASGKKYKKCCLPRHEAARPRSVPETPDKHFISEIRPDVDEAVDKVLARLERGAGRAVEPEIKALLANHPDYHLTHYAMGVYLAMEAKDYAGSVPFFERAVEIFPPFPEAHFNLGNSARKICDIPKAVVAFRTALHYSQDNEVLSGMARKEIQLIESIVLKGTAFSNLDAYLANGRLFDEAFECLSRRELDKAAQLFNLVLRDNPEHVQSFGNLGLVYAGLGRKAAALECLTKALALDPTYEPARSNLSTIEQMTEGEPFVPGGFLELNYYTDRLNQKK